MTDHRSIPRAPIAALVAAIAVSAVAVWLAVRSRDASSVAPTAETASVSESRPVALEPVDSASPITNNAPSANSDETQSAPAPDSDNAQRVDRAPTSRFRGRIVYEATREPVPWCVVAVRAPGQAGELRVADEQGHFATAFEYAATKLDVLAWDGSELPYDWTGAQSIEHIPTNPTEVEVAVRVWTTIIVDGGMPEGRDPRRWHFQLGLGYQFSEARVTRSHVLFWRNHRQPWGGGADGLDDLSRRGPPWWLVIDDEQTELCCSIQLDRLEGVLHISPVWQKRGSLVVALRTEATSRPDYRLHARLRPILTANDEATHGGNLRNSWIRIDNLRPGEFVLDVTSQFCATAHLAVTIRPDELTKAEVLLACEPATDSIRGVVSTESGTHTEDVARFAELRSVENGVLLVQSSLHWTNENGHAVGRFETGALPGREYELSLNSNSAIATRPALPLIVKPGDAVELTVLDRAPKIDVGFEVFDKETGAAIDSFSVRVDSGSNDWSVQGVRSHEVVMDTVPVGAHNTWAVWNYGYARVVGTLESASHSWKVDGGRRWVRVELERGDSVTVVVHANDGSWEDFTPIVGASVLVDGREVGRTDRRGSFQLKFSAAPKSIDVRYLDWRQVDGSPFHATSGRYSESRGEIEFTLEPP
jgi:hypothetical protein